MPDESCKSSSFPQNKYAKLQTANRFKCGGSKCSCQFQDKRTSTDIAAMSIASSSCHPTASATNNGYRSNSWRYLGV